MTVPASHKKWFKSDPYGLQFDEGQIDEEAGVLKDVVMCQEGEAKGHGFHMEGEFISDLVKYDKKHHKNSGLKARFDHPGMCDGTMGSQLGKFKNFRVREAEVIDTDSNEKKQVFQAIADLELLDSADLSPTRPSMKSWVLSMAKESPDFLMSSIVFRFTSYYQRDEKGKKKYVYTYEEYEDENGVIRERYVRPDEELGKVFIEFGDGGRHYYTDLVEAGAATGELFSAQFNSEKFGVQILEWLRERPEIVSALQNNPARIIKFCNQLNIKIQRPMGSLKEYFFGTSDNETDQPDDVKQFKKELDEVRKEVKQLQKERDVLKVSLQKAEQERDSLKVKVAELSKEPAEEPTSTSKEDAPPAKEKAYEKNPIYKKAKGVK